MSCGLRAMPSANRPLFGVVFDMDGTLTVPCLDFKKLRQLLGISDGTDILSHVAGLSDGQKETAMTIVEKFEEEGREKLQIQPGLAELFQFLRETTGLNLGLLTRNSAEAVDHFLSKCNHLGIFAKQDDPFSTILTRDFTPVKPDPAPLLHIAKQWKTEASRLLMVGDDQHDIQCGIAAGAATVLLNNEKNKGTQHLATFNVDTLLEIIPIVKEHLGTELSKET